MNMRVKYDEPKHPGLRLMIQHGSGTREGLRRLDADIQNGAPGTRFDIKGADGEVLISGTFWGDERDRDAPLMSARIMSLDGADAVSMEYADGDEYFYNADYDAVIAKR